MKSFLFSGKESVKHLFLALTIILGFIFIVAFSALYVSDAITRGNACGCVIPIPYMILILSSLGLFIGSLASYLLISRHAAERQVLDKEIMATLAFLAPEERQLIKGIISQKGEVAQARLERVSGFHRVKVHRLVNRLVERGILQKEAQGKTNRITLNPKLQDLFCKKE